MTTLWTNKQQIQMWLFCDLESLCSMSAVLDPTVQRHANKSISLQSQCSFSIARLHLKASGQPGWLVANRKYGMGK